jgi:hypothetical protein
LHHSPYNCATYIQVPYRGIRDIEQINF